jgi:hypothetical protein
LLLPGAAYFLWRWHYFGEFWPLPFLVKSDTVRRYGLIGIGSLAGIFYFALPTSLLVGLGCGQATLRPRNAALVVSLLVVPTLFYTTMRLDQNFADRLFYYIPLSGMIMIAANWDRLAVRRPVLLIVGVGMLLLGTLLAGPFLFGGAALDRENETIALATDFRGIKGTLATSEAGRLPYYSDWRTIDLWGLNTPEFAHHFIQPADAVALDSDLVVLSVPGMSDGCWPHADWQTPYRTRGWGQMVANVVSGLQHRPYALYMVPYDGKEARQRLGLAPGQGRYDCYFVRDGARQRDAIVSVLSRHGALTRAAFESAENQLHRTDRDHAS